MFCSCLCALRPCACSQLMVVTHESQPTDPREEYESKQRRSKMGQGKQVKEMDIKVQEAALKMESSKKAFASAVIAVDEAEKSLER